MIGVGGSALQEDGGDPDVDEGAMSSERDKRQTRQLLLSSLSKATEKTPDQPPAKQNATLNTRLKRGVTDLRLMKGFDSCLVQLFIQNKLERGRDRYVSGQVGDRDKVNSKFK